MKEKSTLKDVANYYLTHPLMIYVRACLDKPKRKE